MGAWGNRGAMEQEAWTSRRGKESRGGGNSKQALDGEGMIRMEGVEGRTTRGVTESRDGKNRWEKGCGGADWRRDDFGCFTGDSAG